MNTACSPLLTARPASRPLCEAPDTDPSDAALLLAARSGDDTALERLLSRREHALYLLCRSILLCREDAEDAVQETFFRALRGLRRLRGDTALRPWLTRIAVNVCLEHKRRQTRRETELLASEDEVSCPSPEAAVLDRLCVLEALATIPPRGRAILLLKEREGWDTREIARAARCTERQVYYELQKAYRALAAWRTAHPEWEPQR